MRCSHITLMILPLCLCACLLLGLGSTAPAQPFGENPGGQQGGPFSQLTEEQRQAIHELIEGMRAEEASRQEIHQAVAELFAEWGIEMPAPPGGHEGRRGDGRKREGPGDLLTEEQRAVLNATTLKMWREGASREETHQAVAELFQGWGVEASGGGRGHHGPGELGPEPGGIEPDGPEPGKPRPGGPGSGMGRGTHLPREIFDQLSEEQREQIQQIFENMHQQGADREEIRTAVESKLAEWGIELPEPPPELTQEQRKALHAVIYELWTGGATRDEIRSAAARHLESFGLTTPDHGPGPLGHGPWPGLDGCLRPQLTEQQRETIHETIGKLHEQGISSEEIHQAIHALMSDFGIEVPDLDTELTAEQRSTLRTSILDLWLAGADREDICQQVGDLLEGFGVELPERSGELESGEASESAALQAQNFPNPANPETQITYNLGVSDEVTIQIYNIAGQLVRTYDMGYQSPGSYSVRWDGRHQNGQLVASGVYFYRIQAGPHAVTNRIVLLK
jgi:Spy/CpxP family protein refolding chaperone